ncbi:glyceraldehyde 3-phosphate dehydrogenase NAD-binding domain-containing protein [Streptomyces sp. NPDC046939]|uniref:glyceraldehyde 3-phosphate dehydrogenase NAD-binding domain-containing protein n=1 Tax=Streptomyces sp. NPDC046939 TaxID=3155376 RepID=UPI0033EF8433
MTIRVGINGFGRIGRTYLRAAMDRVEEEPLDLEVVAINDIASPVTLAHLLSYDSTFGPLRRRVRHGDTAITVDGHEIAVSAERDPAALRWADAGVDVVIESTGRFRTRDSAALHLKAGARTVLLSAPGKDVLPPAVGALLQEGIDAAVILNALRALRVDRALRPALTPAVESLIHRFALEHADLQDVLDAVRDAAGRLSDPHGAEARAAVEEAHRLLTERLLPHEYAEEHELYPALAPALGGPEATTTMSRTHTEIERLSRRIATHLRLAHAGGGLVPEQLDDLRSCLYGLNTVLRLHFAQEEEGYFSLAADEGASPSGAKNG